MKLKKLSLEIDDMSGNFDMTFDNYINMYLSNINDVIKIRTSDFMKPYLNETATLSKYAKFIYDILKTGETCWINTLEASIIRMETRQLEIKRIDGGRAYSSSQITPDFLSPESFITEIDYLLPDGSMVLALEKDILLSDRSSIDDASAYADFLYEITLQEYAYQLIVNTITRAKVPKIFYVKEYTDNKGKHISFCMERLERIPKSSIYKFYKTWDPVIHKVFEYFAENHLYHLDTAYRNMYITKDDRHKKLVIIDFGEARIYDSHDDEIYATSQKTGYPIRRISRSIKRRGVTSWMYPESKKDSIFDLESKGMNEEVLKRARIFSYGGRTKKIM